MKSKLAPLHSTFARIIEGAPRIEMGDVAPLVRRKVEVRMGEEYPELGIRSFGKGTFNKPALDYLSVGTKKLYRIEPGDLLFSNVFAWEGAIAVAKPEDVGRFGSHRFISCVPLEGIATPGFLCFTFSQRKVFRKSEKHPPAAQAGIGRLAWTNWPRSKSRPQLTPGNAGSIGFKRRSVRCLASNVKLRRRWTPCSRQFWTGPSRESYST